MYLSIGTEKHVKKSEVLGIFDIDEAGSASSLKMFLSQKEKENRTHMASDALPKSFVVLTNGEVWFSPYSAKVLRRRAEKAYLDVMIPKGDTTYFLCK